MGTARHEKHSRACGIASSRSDGIGVPDCSQAIRTGVEPHKGVEDIDDRLVGAVDSSLGDVAFEHTVDVR